MILSVTLSKPVSNIAEILGKDYIKIKISIENSANGTSYFAQMFTKTQVFHQHMKEEELITFLEKNVGTTFKNCVKRTETEEITTLTNKKGKTSTITKKNNNGDSSACKLKVLPSAKKKNYLIPENTPVPFLVMLGVMTSEGKIISSKYDKFRQINRFLEFIDDIIPAIYNGDSSDCAIYNGDSPDCKNPLRIVDFGCGKSYLTFAVHYFLTEIRHIPCQIEGLDLKEDVINYCNEMAKKLNLKGLEFKIGNIADYSGKDAPDLVITLHACDTATDFALKYAVERGTKAILSVPCCQHQINQQLQKSNEKTPEEFVPLLKWGIIREKFSALVTDALRGEWLESQGYKVQMLEFIDMEHTPKNILIRAVKTGKNLSNDNKNSGPALKNALGVEPEIWR